ncbi:MAG: peptidylprolyl isomerase [Proteobacteria bacterium]|nr:peptidylprolyl isomerase [Desulfobacteraceae bacterium]MBU2521764.1 peptidylprolyl isomerase [Pseudomonadota bacterium]MBU4069176.1 peptidylprolyl isomerase [Pseudomonadota bacterium]MBU4101065.1 peptidylprolyl isomerase [Pseudomonadota bacterium]MBU4127705.1 peptidylprolyl isomerase [Pseudomonadota bacterium]
MKIAENLFVAIEYCLSLDSGEEVDRSRSGNPLSFIAGTGQIIPGLEKELMGMKAGDSANITVEPDDAYGPAREDLMHEIPRSQFPVEADINPGTKFQAQSPNGPIMIVIKTVEDDNVTVDLNHPLAGQRLHFDVKIVEVREPNAQELASAAGGCSCGTESPGNCGPGCSCG